jgi:archaellum component FlaC
MIQATMLQSGAASKVSLSSTDKPLEGGCRLKEIKTRLDQKKVHDEEEQRARKKKDQEKLQAEIGCSPVSIPASLAGGEAVAHQESDLPFRSRRTLSQTQVPAQQGPDSELRELKAEVDRLKEDLHKTKAQLKDLEHEKDEAQKQQREAALLDAQEEVARLKRTVKYLDDRLEETNGELKRLRAELHESENRVDDLEDQVRVLRRRKTNEEDEILPDNETTQSCSPERVKEEKVRKLSTSKKAPGLGKKRFIVTVPESGKKAIIRSKGGMTPLSLR